MRFSEDAIGPFDFFGTDLDKYCTICPKGDCDCIRVGE